MQAARATQLQAQLSSMHAEAQCLRAGLQASCGVKVLGCQGCSEQARDEGSCGLPLTGSVHSGNCACNE